MLIQYLEVTGLNVWGDPSCIDVLEVVDHVVDHLSAAFAKLKTVHADQERISLKIKTIF